MNSALPWKRNFPGCFFLAVRSPFLLGIWLKMAFMDGIITLLANKGINKWEGGCAVTIVEQYRECFKDVPVGTKFTRKQIIDMMHEKFGTNETSIIPSDHSYNMTNKGLRGANRENNFFLNVGDGEYEYVGEHFTGMAISDVIQLYKLDFERVNREERYKWEAIGWYKKHWDIDAPDFARMFSVSFSKHLNLLAAGMYYPYKMACQYAEAYPEYSTRVLATSEKASPRLVVMMMTPRKSRGGRNI